MTRILVTGANGQVGFELCRKISHLGEIFPFSRSALDLTIKESIISVLDSIKPNIIINPAAYTAVDKAETEIETAYAVNSTAPSIISAWAKNNNALFIHYSTDYIFDGDKQNKYLETDAANPKSVYGKSKWLGEENIRHNTENHVILRTSWVYGQHGNNFLKTILRLAETRETLNVINDQFGAPTSAALIANTTAHILNQYLKNPNQVKHGTYHLTAQNHTSWYEYAHYIVSQAKKMGAELLLQPGSIIPIPTEEYPLPAQRPSNSRLACDKLTQNFSLQLPDWKTDVSDTIQKLIINI